VTEDLNPGGSAPRGSAIERFRRTVVAHPVIVGVLVGSTVIGLVLGLLLLPESWTVVRRALGGAVGGAGCGLICTAPRIIG
jgi:hypothetical protein